MSTAGNWTAVVPMYCTLDVDYAVFVRLIVLDTTACVLLLLSQKLRPILARASDVPDGISAGIASKYDLVN